MIITTTIVIAITIIMTMATTIIIAITMIMVERSDNNDYDYD